jgi:hypothetical protein
MHGPMQFAANARAERTPRAGVRSLLIRHAVGIAQPFAASGNPTLQENFGG